MIGTSRRGAASRRCGRRSPGSDGQGVHLLGLAAWVLASFAACGRTPEPEPLRVGLLADMAHIDAQPVLNAAELAVRKLRDGTLTAGARRYQVELFVEKSFTTPQEATEAARRLIEAHQVAVLIGPSFSREAIRIGAVAENARIPMISPAATHPDITAGRQYVFRVTYVDTFQGRVMARFARQDLAAMAAAVLFDVADAYSRSVAGVFRDSFQSAGGTIVAFESYTTGDADWSGQLRRIRSAEPQVLLLPNYHPGVSAQARQARDLGVEAVLLGTDGWTPEAVAHLPAFDGAFCSEPWHVEVARTEARARSFVDAYQRAYGMAPNSLAALTYDGFGLLFEAVRRHGADPEQLRLGLARTEAFAGVTGKITYGTKGGDPMKPVAILKVEGGRAVLHRRILPWQEP